MEEEKIVVYNSEEEEEEEEEQQQQQLDVSSCLLNFDDWYLYENATVGADILRPAVCNNDVIKKTESINLRHEPIFLSSGLRCLRSGQIRREREREREREGQAGRQAGRQKRERGTETAIDRQRQR